MHSNSGNAWLHVLLLTATRDWYINDRGGEHVVPMGLQNKPGRIFYRDFRPYGTVRQPGTIEVMITKMSARQKHLILKGFSWNSFHEEPSDRLTPRPRRDGISVEN